MLGPLGSPHHGHQVTSPYQDNRLRALTMDTRSLSLSLNLMGKSHSASRLQFAQEMEMKGQTELTLAGIRRLEVQIKGIAKDNLLP